MTDEYSEQRDKESRRCLEEKLKAIEQKLDHIIYRLSEEDPRIYKPRAHDFEDEDCERNDNDRDEPKHPVARE